MVASTTPRILAKLAATVSVLSVFAYLLATVLAIVLLVVSPLGEDFLSRTASLIVVGLGLAVFTPLQIGMLGSFVVFLGIYGLCFATAAKTEGGYVTGLRSLVKGSPNRKVLNWLILMPIAASALLLLVVAISLVEAALGIPIGEVNLAPPDLLYILARDPILEEVAFRITTLGILVALRVLWGYFLIPDDRRRGLGSLLLTSFVFPDRAKGQTGMSSFSTNGWRGIHWTEWTVLLLTSAGFGLAHLFSPLGWELGKVLTASISGFALGLAYLVYGAYASILLHWFFDLYLGVFEVGYRVGVDWYGIIGGLLTLFTIFVGLIGTAVLAGWTISRRNTGSYEPQILSRYPPAVPPSVQ